MRGWHKVKQREGLAQDAPAGWRQSPIAADLQPVPIFPSEPHCVPLLKTLKIFLVTAGIFSILCKDLWTDFFVVADWKLISIITQPYVL